MEKLKLSFLSLISLCLISLVILVNVTWDSYLGSGNFTIICVNIFILSAAIGCCFGLRTRMKKWNLQPATLSGLLYGFGTLTINAIIAYIFTRWVQHIPSKKDFAQIAVVGMGIWLICIIDYQLHEWILKKIKEVP